jgi:hypothetical protein
MKKLALFLLVFALVAAACGGGDDDSATGTDGTSSKDDNRAASDDDSGSDDSDNDAATDDGSSSDDSSSGDGGGGSFCDQARALEEADFLSDMSLLSEDFFAETERALAQIIDDAPAEIRDDVATLLDGFRDLGATLEEYDYNLLDPELQQELEDLDTSTFEEAGSNIEDYLEQVCGIAPEPDTDEPVTTDGGSMGGLGDLDPSQLQAFTSDPAALTALLAGMGLDAETAECLATEAQDFDFENADLTEILNEPICDTSLGEILATIGVAIPTPPSG